MRRKAKMRTRKIVLVLLAIAVIVKISFYQICKMIDKGFSSHSLSLVESKRNKFLINEYSLEEVLIQNQTKRETSLELGSIFLENNWDYKCSIWRIDKVPEKVNGYNVVLPIRAETLKDLDQYSFLLVAEKDTIVLRGNRTKETAYYRQIQSKKFPDSQLLMINRKSELVSKFNLKKK